jgi:prepilin-type N-terminal cleavage/methylation domain-containing protein
MKRDGFTLVEISAAVVVLAVCAILFAQLVALTTSVRHAERLRQTAIDQTQNILERLATVPPEKLATLDFDKTSAESLIERSLPDGNIAFATTEMEPDRVLFTVTVSWSNGDKKPRIEITMFRLLTLVESSTASVAEPNVQIHP